MIPIPPSWVLSGVVAGIYATSSHLIWGKTFKELAIYWGAGIIGFAVGQILGHASPFHFLMIGNVHIVGGTVMSWIALFLARRLLTETTTGQVRRRE